MQVFGNGSINEEKRIRTVWSPLVLPTPAPPKLVSCSLCTSMPFSVCPLASNNRKLFDSLVVNVDFLTSDRDGSGTYNGLLGLRLAVQEEDDEGPCK